MKNSLLMFISLNFLFVILMNESVAAEVNKVEVEPQKQVSVPEVKPALDEIVPESKASVAQENSLKKPGTKSIIVNDNKPKQESDLIDGLILNRAMTRLGHRFYREFVAAYRDIGGNNKHSGLTVVEQATARSGSKILIQHNRKTIFVTFVSPVSRNMDDQADYAAKRVNAAVTKRNEQAVLGALFDPDLAPDEI
ncbi:curli production assembly/transport protein CsgE [uncultured Shewanella sp.]|uniref:curli production assembly/transport protein CsgE n=1 Tax=uncultured Shewanella sp. TaxID=173975 RepID=UPI002622A66F|nr:curli production assembly/transport protein CsgE [uncultured Shewanella sp.]